MAMLDLEPEDMLTPAGAGESMPPSRLLPSAYRPLPTVSSRLCLKTGENSKREGEAPAEPRVSRTSRLGGSLALPNKSCFQTEPSTASRS